MDSPKSRLYNYHSPLGRSRFNRVTTNEQQRKEYLGEIHDMFDETEFLVSFGKHPPPPLPFCLASPKSKNKISITTPESLSQEEIDQLIKQKVKSLTPKRPLRPIHYTRRTESALLNSPIITSRGTLSPQRSYEFEISPSPILNLDSENEEEESTEVEI